ncbi:MAG: class I SAM-dependent methyltransferase [Helicobacteraceae bacterium]|jgi:SAM-dependent methyltransferase|nr:class I SAM-dependent methyltransferase [Helicobacteraceae bacterium]
MDKESPKARLFRLFYEKICGKEPNINILHWQYLATYQLKPQLKEILRDFSGVCLDFGCGSQPYKAYMPNITRYIGADIVQAKGIELIVKNGVVPPTDELDCVLSTQVLEHVEDATIFTQIFERVKRGGKIAISVPFLYHAHGSPFDFRRFTKEGLRLWIESFGLKVERVQTQGGIGSTLTILFLAWLESNTTRSAIGKTIKVFGMPLFIPFAFCCNLFGILFDKIDRSGGFYNNVIIEASR